MNQREHIAYMNKKRDHSISEFERLYTSKGVSWADFFTVTTRRVLTQ